jgi:hypothetical protein
LVSDIGHHCKRLRHGIWQYSLLLHSNNMIILLFPNSNLCPNVTCSRNTGQYVLERRHFFRNFGAKISSVGSPFDMLTQLSVHRKLLPHLQTREPMRQRRGHHHHLCLKSSNHGRKLPIKKHRGSNLEVLLVLNLCL